jgi:hypothetical protein
MKNDVQFVCEENEGQTTLLCTHNAYAHYTVLITKLSRLLKHYGKGYKWAFWCKSKVFFSCCLLLECKI